MWRCCDLDGTRAVRRAVALLGVGLSGLACLPGAGQVLEFTIDGKIEGHGVSGGPDLNALIAEYPEDTPVSLTLRIDRLGPTQGQVTELSGAIAGQAIELFDVSTVELPPGFVPNVVDFVNDETAVSVFSGDFLDMGVIVEGPTAVGLPLDFFSIDLLDETGMLFAPGQADLFTAGIDVDVFDDSPTSGFLQFVTPGGGFGGPSAFLRFSVTDVTQVGGAALPGDYNGSGSVEQGDLDLVLGNWGGLRPFEAAGGGAFLTDAVDQEELDRVLGNWGASTSPSFIGAMVPEPGGVLLIGGLGLLGWRRRVG